MDWTGAVRSSRITSLSLSGVRKGTSQGCGEDVKQPDIPRYPDSNCWPTLNHGVKQQQLKKERWKALAKENSPLIVIKSFLNIKLHPSSSSSQYADLTLSSVVVPALYVQVETAADNMQLYHQKMLKKKKKKSKLHKLNLLLQGFGKQTKSVLSTRRRRRSGPRNSIFFGWRIHPANTGRYHHCTNTHVTRRASTSSSTVVFLCCLPSWFGAQPSHYLVIASSYFVSSWGPPQYTHYTLNGVITEKNNSAWWWCCCCASAGMVKNDSAAAKESQTKRQPSRDEMMRRRRQKTTTCLKTKFVPKY